MKHLKSKYSGHIKEADLHLLRKKGRSDQSLLPGTFCLFQKNFSRSPGTLIWVLQHRVRVLHKFPILFMCVCFCCSYPLLVPSLLYSVLIFFNYQTVGVSYHSKLSLSHSGSASLSLLARLFHPGNCTQEAGRAKGKDSSCLNCQTVVCVHELYTSSVKEKMQVNTIKYQKNDGKAWLNYTDVSNWMSWNYSFAGEPICMRNTPSGPQVLNFLKMS